MASFFPNPYASNQFNHLHELVLELKYGDLDAELSRENFNIDAQDSDGNSALEWACTRGDHKTVKWLLDHGADVNLANLNNGRTPLMAACACASLPCVELLLNHNADVNVENFWGLDAMIYLCNEDRSPQPVTDIVHAAKMLISRGIKLSPRGVHRVSCLSRAARTQLIPVMELILEQGVDIDLRNQFGSTALSSSVAWSASRSVKFLLDQGASYTEADIDGRTLLHVAALNASIDIVDVLREADLEGLDPDLTDNESHTAEDYVERARELPEAFAPAFRHLLSDLRARYQQEGEDWNTAHGSPEGERESDDEDFLDACEFLESAPEVTSAPVRT
jgi:ankyrin repeat protein